MNRGRIDKLELFKFEKLREKFKDNFRDNFKDKFYNKTAGFIDRMCCCSYSGQQMFNEADEMVYNLDDYSIVDTVWLEETIKNRPADCEKDSKVQEREQPDEGLWVYKGVRGSISSGTEVTVASTYHQSPSFACSVSSPTQATTPINESSCTAEVFPSRQAPPAQREISLPLRRVPSEVERLQGKKDLRVWSQLSKQESITRMQSESLAELPYLNMTEGYRC